MNELIFNLREEESQIHFQINLHVSPGLNVCEKYLDPQLTSVGFRVGTYF